MDITIHPGRLSGTIPAIPSKSQAHRFLVCAALAAEPTELLCTQTNQDIEATADCLNALGATIHRFDSGYTIQPIKHSPRSAVLNCRESGSTLRFLLPVAGALGIDTVFQMSGRLPNRPLSPLWEEMERMGCSLSRPTATTIRCQGQLKAGNYQISGSVSSQYISGLLFALAILQDKSKLTVTDRLESAPYVSMTQQPLETIVVPTKDLSFTGCHPLHSPGKLSVEGDWSNAAFFLAAKALGSQLNVTDLNSNSLQGDRRIIDCLRNLTEHTVISAADIPDLVPILSVVAAANRGAVFKDIRRLRLKESDRVAAVIAMLHALGGKANATEDTLTVHPATFTGGCVESMNDHRIAMAAAIAATVASGPVTIRNAECVSKSYPAFWEDYAQLGGQYE